MTKWLESIGNTNILLLGFSDKSSCWQCVEICLHFLFTDVFFFQNCYVVKRQTYYFLGSKWKKNFFTTIMLLQLGQKWCKSHNNLWHYFHKLKRQCKLVCSTHGDIENVKGIHKFLKYCKASTVHISNLNKNALHIRKKSCLTRYI